MNQKGNGTVVSQGNAADVLHCGLTKCVRCRLLCCVSIKTIELVKV